MAAMEGALGAILAGMSEALATPTWLVLCSTATTLSAIDLGSIDLPSEIDSILGSSDIGSPSWAWASLTGTTIAATRVYGRRGDGAGGTSATEGERKSITCQAGSPARRVGESFARTESPFTTRTHAPQRMRAAR